ncbi:hypothetical protein KIPB_000499 [Kipferlia bialata]|uniref:SET domain-containing protein n=1 Tax=Kipferlia bialata TaxID=797122 RepID=A0A9K3GEQ5_9EUKA|nr:hypothetical protein KIPB_000499 [Kipferlia bialata]|eukprot:g499.t1
MKAAAYRLTKIKGKGMGLVAARDLKQGSLVVSELPVLFIPGKSNDLLVQEEFAKLHPKKQRQMMELFDVNSTHGGAKTPEGVFITNAYRCPLGNALFPTAARINHSCAPNLTMTHREDTQGRAMIRTACDVREGQELTLCYTDPWLCRQERHEYLERMYDFTCKCSTCSLTGEAMRESERRRERAAVLRVKVAQNLAMCLEHSTPEDLLTEVEEALDIARTELFCEPTIPLMSERAMVLALLCKKPELAQKYADETVRVRLVTEGGHKGLERFRQYAKCPSSHPGAMALGVGSLPAESPDLSAAGRVVPPCYSPMSVVPIEGKGMGVVATRHIIRGELILDEAPLLSLTQLDANLIGGSGASIGSLLLDKLQRISPAQRAAFWQLRETSDSDVGSAARASSIFMCNSTTGADDRMHVYLFGCRFRHNCVPNVLGLDTLSKKNHMRYRAMRDIEEGEEMTVAYVIDDHNFTMGKEELDTLLEQRRVSSCDCELCSLTGPALARSRRRRKKMQALYDESKNYYQPGQLPKLKELISLIEEDIQSPFLVADIHTMALFTALEDEPRSDAAGYHALEALKCKMLSEGDHMGLEQAKAWAERPALARGEKGSTCEYYKPLEFPYVDRDPDMPFAVALRQHEEDVQRQAEEAQQKKAAKKARSKSKKGGQKKKNKGRRH